MATVTPKLAGDLGQRYEVRKKVDHFTWVSVGWSDNLSEAESIERHFRTDTDALKMQIIDREQDGVTGTQSTDLQRSRATIR